MTKSTEQDYSRYDILVVRQKVWEFVRGPLSKTFEKELRGKKLKVGFDFHLGLSEAVEKLITSAAESCINSSQQTLRWDHVPFSGMPPEIEYEYAEKETHDQS